MKTEPTTRTTQASGGHFAHTMSAYSIHAQPKAHKSVAAAVFAALALSCTDTEVPDTGAQTAPTTPSSSTADATSISQSGAPADSSAQAGAAAPAGGATPMTSSLVLPPLQPGFQRFIAPPIELESGVSDDWIHWVGGPTEQDFDVETVKGAQSRGGHHALMLSIREPNPVGFTRKYTERDQLTSTSLGGVGAEGAAPIPEGVVFRVKKGSYLAIQTHYLNPTNETLIGETYVDMKLTPTDPANTLASHFGSTSIGISLAPHAENVMDINCTIEQDLRILRMTNHMHHYGVSVFTEVTDPAGITKMLKQDDAWTEDWALTPNYDNFTVVSPLVIANGSTLHTRCVWNNDSDQEVTFPTEMCVFATVILGDNDITCIDGQFRVTNAEPDPSTAATDAPTTPQAGAAAPAMPGDDTAGGAGACTNSADSAVLTSDEFVEAQRTCGAMCLGDTEMCTTACLEKTSTLTPACAACNGAYITCAMSHCLADCTGGFMSPTCRPCAEEQCGTPYHACSGL